MLPDSLTTTRVLPRDADTVLLIDDVGSVCAVMRRIIGEQGYGVFKATDGERAIARVSSRNGPLDPPMTDVVMPGLGGRALIEWFPPERAGFKALLVFGERPGRDT